METYTANSPEISVILPTYNRASLILRAVNSVFKQTFRNWELIIVDDGSDDNTFGLLDKIVLSNENVKYIKHKNRKLPLSLNTGILISSGRYLAFIGSDDEYLPEHLFIRYDYMKKNPDIDLIHGGVKIIGDAFVKDFNDVTKKIHLDECVIGGTFFGKREVFVQLKGFSNIPYGEDYELTLRAANKFKMMKANFPTYIYYRDTEGSICNTI